MTGRPERTGRVRDLTQRAQSGRRDSFEAFRELVQFLFSLTVLDRSSSIALRYGPRKDAAVLTGLGGPLLLNDERFLRFDLSVYLDPHAGWLKTSKASYQYQLDRDGHQWICRYDYLREPGPDPHPQAHLQLRGFLEFDRDRELSRIHFPTGRVTVEAVIRLLADQFEVACNEEASVWRPVLTESEKLFLEKAHHPLSGPAG